MNDFKIIIDKDIPFIKGVLEPYCSPFYIKGSEINAEITKSAHALIIRTRTQCNKELLQGSLVKAIFSATIGSDHIDLDYCKTEGVAVFTAAGCNANGVVQYVLTTLFALMQKNGSHLLGKTVGIIGAGNVGERLALLMERFGFSVLRCDPPKSLISSSVTYYELDYVLENSQIITLHVPLNNETKKICSYKFLDRMNKGAILLNSSRGEVIDEAAIIESRGKLGGLIVDVWNDEPDINAEFLSIVDVATPHIAGYSLEGKINATVISVLSFAKFFNISELKNFMIVPPVLDSINHKEVDRNNKTETVASILLDAFPVWDQDSKLRANPGNFEKTRSEYVYRRELSQSVIRELEKLTTSAKLLK